MIRAHARNCACPRCRHVRALAPPTPRETRRFTVGLCALAAIAGALLNTACPAERLLGTEYRDGPAAR